MTTATDREALVERLTRAAEDMWHSNGEGGCKALLREAAEALSSSASSETTRLPDDCTLTAEQARDVLSHVGWCGDCGAYFDGRAGCPTDIRSDEREKAERVAEGLETALSFTSRLLLDTAVRESIKELRSDPAAYSETQEDRPSQRPEKTADDAPVGLPGDARDAWAMGFNAAMAEVYPSPETREAKNEYAAVLREVVETARPAFRGTPFRAALDKAKKLLEGQA